MLPGFSEFGNIMRHHSQSVENAQLLKSLISLGSISRQNSTVYNLYFLLMVRSYPVYNEKY